MKNRVKKPQPARKSAHRWCFSCHKRSRINLNGKDCCAACANKLLAMRANVVAAAGGEVQQSARLKKFEEWARANDPDALRTEPLTPEVTA